MVYLILVLLALWLFLAILGVLIKGLFWLTVIAAILFVATAVWSGLRSRAGM
ncbi:hypothetical protein ACOQFV_01250 [Nocardiopsis changdeensis]|uniref:Hydrophobic protein n=1 Tax=Nocardiopsis changdeensis TaxID=2831969 RepID=A0ABX8BJQ3_9ACTN|nr:MULTISPECIES: hypothetical protein [Nocardiopsis]QUX22299.1 hypothetical protein KGD84_28835 [Nocardiopsis changdeensis]QYX38240.1 hypothetical protein K1J57_06220 [Nocardiopsis sp. MT53]